MVLPLIWYPIAWDSAMGRYQWKLQHILPRMFSSFYIKTAFLVPVWSQKYVFICLTTKTQCIHVSANFHFPVSRKIRKLIPSQCQCNPGMLLIVMECSWKHIKSNDWIPWLDDLFACDAGLYKKSLCYMQKLYPPRSVIIIHDFKHLNLYWSDMKRLVACKIWFDETEKHVERLFCMSEGVVCKHLLLEKKIAFFIP